MPLSPEQVEERLSWSGAALAAGLDYAAVDADTAGHELMEMLISLKLKSTISARDACVLAFWASKAGAAGPVHKLALRPDAQTGKYSKKFDDVVGTDPRKGDVYMFPTALRPRHDAVRTWADLPAILLLEELVKGLRQEPSETMAELKRSLARDELP